MAAHLKVSAGKINHLVSRLDNQYLRRPRKKRDGTNRILFVPSEKLKLLQRKIYDHILSKVPLLPCAKGGEDVRTTMQLYAQSDQESRLEAQGKFLEVLLGDKAHLLTETIQ